MQCLYRILLHLHLIVDPLQLGQLLCRNGVVTELARSASRAVVSDVEEHATHLLRVVTIDAVFYVAHSTHNYHRCTCPLSACCNKEEADPRGETHNPSSCNDLAGRTCRVSSCGPSSGHFAGRDATQAKIPTPLAVLTENLPHSSCLRCSSWTRLGQKGDIPDHL